MLISTTFSLPKYMLTKRVYFGNFRVREKLFKVLVHLQEGVILYSKRFQGFNLPENIEKNKFLDIGHVYKKNFFRLKIRLGWSKRAVVLLLVNDPKTAKMLALALFRQRLSWILRAFVTLNP